MRLSVATAAILCVHSALSETDMAALSSNASWLVNNPGYFKNTSNKGVLLDVREDSAGMSAFKGMIEYLLPKLDDWTDGEVVDAIEHYFWGMRDGLAMELGALDGSPATRSMTYEYEKTLNWKRILIEGNPSYRTALKTNSSLSFSANAAICATPSTVHYSTADYVGGIVEFMARDFLMNHHRKIFNACKIPGDLSSLDFSTISHLVKPVQCIPLSQVLHKARVKHVNFFILDVEGGELEVLKSINWAHIKFDVMCIETEAANRPPGYAARITAYLGKRGYVTATAQQGRNTWYISKDFVPSARPGLDPQCYNGARKSEQISKSYFDKKTPAFVRCPIV